ncbi:MAG: hypothetical protein US83_C0003G0040 [Candidatus Falkowbacteria bacterium GW2011_GWC2_38_22]|uniref:HAD-superfamily hydrolase, subfamily IA, variant 3 n=1 Tax=Candidatus Falkowbacteria bacterium GW2011_GWE1_38_31 TaxID=1618638 RepID=A0A0G0K6Y0_9BACT|nr:MAG: hypothetical protein US73_C0001G0132 [Candidatus Falkowbacteria bacterium GW2011_GWF2_38_1205]KKQ61791.1 MAG: hypothetical protein US83_C0003G0040 [Candidatus Falkowbacteria bacterium GW2011_GWC2_38_22]KKQ64099.1 MAG: hypothetical protein US84_C0002G0131 [Candidatus Falkowbacteria bacterium GW2011_GWF1_38_22]KKQ66551.1 MAG: hypothetical protein US87_C0001G0072 [Candidatus Falkowbacteria bacterium GW2011_GWE2_38_254]KKQ71205.1 MAG: hypothetical protein US91_C0001G0132 [Candidatus Falkowb
MINCLFFDFGNVIYFADQMIAYKKFSEYSPFSAEKIYELIYLGGIEKIPDEGGTFSNFYLESIKKIKADKKKLTSDIFLEIWCNIFSPVNGMDELLQKIKPDVRKILVSNTNFIHWQGTMSKLPLIKKHFSEKENQVLSFQVGKRKPDNLMWIEAYKKGKCNLDEALFIDDVPLFVDSFQIFGGKGIVFNAKTDSIYFLEKKLKTYDVLI